MQEENRKEVLTNEIIKRELRTIYLLNRKWDIAACVLFGIVAIWSFSVVMSLDDFEYILIPLFFLAFFIVQLLYNVFKIKKTLSRIQNGGVAIIKDTLMECEEKLSSSLPTLKPYSEFYSYLTMKSPYHLRFQCFGTYTIPSGRNYRYCKMYDMEPRGVYNYSNVGDDFYIVTLLGSNEILLAYNTKLFELQK